METTVSRVSRMLKPLIELGYLGRLGDDELRHATRSILECRTATRISKTIHDPESLPINPPLNDRSLERRLVPLPSKGE